MLAAMLLFTIGAFAQPAFYQADRITGFNKVEAKQYFYLRGYRLDSISNDTFMSSNSINIVPTQFAISSYVRGLIANNTITTLPWASITGKPTANGTTSGILSYSDWLGFNGKQAALNGTGLVRMSGTTVSYDNTTYYPASGGNLSSTAIIGMPKINPSTVTTPSSTYINFFFDSLGRFSYRNSSGYLRTYIMPYTGDQLWRFPNKINGGTLPDSTDVATALTGKIDSIRQAADVLYGNAAFTKVGTTGVSNAPLNSQTQNTVFAAPNGSNGTPVFRNIVGADITNSTIDLTTKPTGVLPLANGGTGSSTQNFVDLTNTQTISGNKTFSVGTAGVKIASTVSGNAGNFTIAPDASAAGTPPDFTMTNVGRFSLTNFQTNLNATNGVVVANSLTYSTNNFVLNTTSATLGQSVYANTQNNNGFYGFGQSGTKVSLYFNATGSWNRGDFAILSNNAATTSNVAYATDSKFRLYAATGNVTVGDNVADNAVDKLQIAGNVFLNTAGNKIKQATGTNAAIGTATLSSGTITVNTTAVTASSQIIITVQETGTYNGRIRVSARVASTSFTISSSDAGDNCVVAYQIIN